ncbi:MAG: ChrR family anti-sigma-E factor [Hyphomicrobium sp.]
MKITHCPDHASLMSCSAGSMPEAFAAVMASHISVCPRCRKELATMECIGTTLFDQLQPASVSRPAPLMALRAAEAGDDDAPEPAAARGDVPAPLVAAIGPHLDSVPWKRLAPGVWHHQIELSQPSRGELRLIKVAPGMALPEHGHRGNELTLVLRGAYSDASGLYRAGDVADLDEEVEHQPIADPVEGCICLIAVEGKLKFKSRLAQMVQPLVGL